MTNCLEKLEKNNIVIGINPFLFPTLILSKAKVLHRPNPQYKTGKKDRIFVPVPHKDVVTPFMTLQNATEIRVDSHTNAPSALNCIPESDANLKTFKNNHNNPKNHPLCELDVNLFEWLLPQHSPTKNMLLQGFREGFRLNFKGSFNEHIPRNHLSALHNPTYVDAKLQKELDYRHVSGPYDHPPFSPMFFSPIGLIPKKDPGQFRMIHDLSFPKINSVNSNIPDQYKTVQYEGFDHFAKLLLELPPCALVAKADIRSAFRIIPIHPQDYPILGFTWKGKYYHDMRLPMGAAPSCSIFESFSTSLQGILQDWGVQHTTHILDDFMFLGPPDSDRCQSYLQFFLLLCELLNIPINHNKTVHPSTVVIIHGIQVDTSTRIASLPLDKLDDAKSQIKNLLSKSKVRVKEIQSIIGRLNFACKVVAPGRAFLRRLIDMIIGLTHNYYWVRLSSEAKMDLEMWLYFLEHFNGQSLLTAQIWQSSSKLNLFTDAAVTKGFGLVFDNKWSYGTWPSTASYHITILEMYPIVLALYLWGHELANSSIIFHCDNSSVVDILNKQSSKDPIIMKLVRKFVLRCLQLNINFKLSHIPGVQNTIPDLLSRFQISEARKLAPYLALQPSPINPAWSLSNWLQKG